MKYRIGSFNMKNFGAYPSRDFKKIAEIIHGEKMDIVAFQEVLSEGKGVQRLLEENVRRRFSSWGFCWASPKDTTDISKLNEIIANDRRGEGYAYIWNTLKFKLAESGRLDSDKQFEPRIINSLSKDVKNVECRMFARAPYYIRLQPCHGGFNELRLLNIHIYFGKNTIPEIEKRKIEFDTLVQEIYPRINRERYGNFRSAYTIAMGDYNLNIVRPGLSISPEISQASLNEVYRCTGGRNPYSVITIQEQLTTLRNNSSPTSQGILSNYANNYDHFTYSPETSPFKGVSCYAVDAVSKYCCGDFEYYRKNISDHVPIIMEIDL